MCYIGQLKYASYFQARKINVDWRDVTDARLLAKYRRILGVEIYFRQTCLPILILYYAQS